MASARSSNKSRCKNKNRRSNSVVKKKRSSRKIKNKNVKKKINIPIQQGENLNDDSKTGSHHDVKVLQSPGIPDVNVAKKIHASKYRPPVKEKQTTVHKKQSTDDSEPSITHQKRIPALLQQVMRP
ncbi:Uncharacterized protein Fot_24329 [Forsythia ovata]|uniref:Uncharacterized protein n=1 Tax=Forsythia ovata TaxID=205694 RepID=A0ABD1U5X4_9LAMI